MTDREPNNLQILPYIPTRTFPNASSVEYRRLAERARKGEVVFRIWDDTSRSSLVNTHNHNKNGFTAVNKRFLGMTKFRYTELFAGLYAASYWLEDVDTLVGMMKHLSSFEVSLSTGATPNAAQQVQGLLASTSWISTTACLQWSIFEIARRLAGNPASTVRLTVIRTNNREIRTTVSERLMKYEKDRHRADMDSDDEGINMAELVRLRKQASLSKEEVWVGRIFGASIEYDTVWTVNVSTPNSPQAGGHGIYVRLFLLHLTCLCPCYQ
jgi:hypothetical protein